MRGGGDGRGRGGMVSRGARGGALALRGRVKTPQGHVTQPKNDNSFKLVSRYMCGIEDCNSAFVSLSNLRRHQKSKHAGYQGEGLVTGGDDDGEDDGFDVGMDGEYLSSFDGYN